MVTFFYADISSLKEDEILRKYKDKVDKERLEKVLRTGTKKDQVRSLAAGYLLQLGMKERMGKEAQAAEEDFQVIPLTYTFSENGKPYLAKDSGLYFSLSHSGDFSACAIADQEIGMDIQAYRTIQERLPMRFFTEVECTRLEEVKEDRDKYEALFFNIWSAKESYLKFTGKGLQLGMNTFFTDLTENKVKSPDTGKEKASLYMLQEIKGYACCICMKDTIGQVEIKKIIL